jgi:hypothetical protein
MNVQGHPNGIRTPMALATPYNFPTSFLLTLLANLKFGTRFVAGSAPYVLTRSSDKIAHQHISASAPRLCNAYSFAAYCHSSIGVIASTLFLAIFGACDSCRHDKRCGDAEKRKSPWHLCATIADPIHCPSFQTDADSCRRVLLLTFSTWFDT